MAGLDEVTTALAAEPAVEPVPRMRPPRSPAASVVAKPNQSRDDDQDKKPSGNYKQPQRNTRGGGGGGGGGGGYRNTENRNGNRSDNRNDNRAKNRGGRDDDANAIVNSYSERNAYNQTYYQKRQDFNNRGEQHYRSNQYGDNTNRQGTKSLAYMMRHRLPQADIDNDIDESWDVPVYKNAPKEASPRKEQRTQTRPEPQTQTSAEPQAKGYPKPKEAELAPKVEPKKVDEAKVKQPVKDFIAKVSVEEKPAPVQASVPPASVQDVTPAKKMIPKNYVVETLSLGDELILSVENTPSECRIPSGHVCLALHADVEQLYSSLCDEYAALCDRDTACITPTPGEPFSIRVEAEEAWYRARCVSATHCALFDASKVIEIGSAPCKKLPSEFATLPEFCCVLHADCVQVGEPLKAILLAKTDNGYRVRLESPLDGKVIGEGEIARWLPHIDYPKIVRPAAAASPVQPAQVPEVQRPALVHNSLVELVDCEHTSRLFVRPAAAATQRDFDMVMEDAMQYGQTATPLTQPPSRGQLVISRFTDGRFYRALVKRTSVKTNKYLLEYIEFGNEDIVHLETLYQCPTHLQLETYPVQTSQVSLHDVTDTLTPPAAEYLTRLRDDNVQLTLSLPSGEKSAPNGSPVILTVKKNNESVNRKVADMCASGWEKLQAEGIDVVETRPIMYTEVEYTDLPEDGCELEILDFSGLQNGCISAYDKAAQKHADYVFGPLTEKMAKYCESEIGREPYLPKNEEVCIGKCPGYPQWFRAVLVQQENGPGGKQVSLLYMDYGNIEVADVNDVRKMLPEFVKGIPALIVTCDIRDFPENPTEAQLVAALQHFQMTDEGRGRLKITRAVKENAGLYTVDAPDLIEAMLKAA